MRSAVLGLALVLAGISSPQAQEPRWYLKAHIDEACSCPLFCPCYFNPSPAGDRCNFNNVFTVERGYYGDTVLDGMHVWISGNLKGDLAKGFDGVILAFEPGATEAQVKGFAAIATKLYPLPMDKVVTTDRTQITILHTPQKHVASRADGAGRVELTLPVESSQDGKNVPEIRNLKYWGAQNSGFKLYRGTHYYKGHGYDYSYKQRNGFTIDVEIGSAPR
jgi:hypothetical protein